MTKMLIMGDKTTVTIVEVHGDDESFLAFTCDMGAWCPHFEQMRSFTTTNWGDLINEATIHADTLDHE